MSLTWKDAVATLLLVVVTGVAYFQYRGIPIPLIDNPRITIIVLGLVGIMMCGLGSADVTGGMTPVLAVLSLLGGVAMILIILGLITGLPVFIYLLAGVIGLLWIISTMRHTVL